MWYKSADVPVEPADFFIMEAVSSLEKLYISANVSSDTQEDVTVMKSSHVMT